MAARLGKMEKFILLNLTSSFLQGNKGHGIDSSHSYAVGITDRSQLVYSLHCIMSGDLEKNFRSNVKGAMDAKEYSRLQSTISRAANRLIEKGFLVRMPARSDVSARRRLSYAITPDGAEQCGRLLDDLRKTTGRRKATRRDVRDHLF